MELQPWSDERAECPKCGSTTVSTTFCRTYETKQDMIHNRNHIEYLGRTCMCGYRWRMATKDAVGVEGE